MKQGLFTIIENVPIADKVMKMRLRGDLSAITAPGQFVNIKIDELYLRRPISVCDAEDDILTLIYKVVGTGTEIMSGMQSGALDILTGLGNGYDLNCCGDAPLLLGGGVGVPPLYLLAKKLLKNGKSVRAVLGFNRKSDVFYEDEFRSLGVDTTPTEVTENTALLPTHCRATTLIFTPAAPNRCYTPYTKRQIPQGNSALKNAWAAASARAWAAPARP